MLVAVTLLGYAAYSRIFRNSTLTVTGVSNTAWKITNKLFLYVYDQYFERAATGTPELTSSVKYKKP